MRYPHLRTRESPRSVTATIDKPVAQLDVEAVDKASQTLSSEMLLPSLLEKLMRLALEHAGAGRGLLILLHEDEPYIEAEATTGHGSVEVALRRTRVAPSDLPQSALQYVLRTHERLVLDDASAENFDPDDTYLRRNRSRSVLCLPIIEIGHQASDIVRSIRSMLRKSAPEFSQLDLNEVIMSVVDLLRSELQSKAVTLEISLSAELSRVHGDRVQLQQVILNLVKNGIEAMSGQAPGRRLLRLATLRTANGAVLAAVEDSGSGLDAIQASRIFEPFFTTKRDGMGLGLAICQTIVETHGGKLWMMPRVPRGCSFQFELPPANSG